MKASELQLKGIENSISAQEILHYFVEYGHVHTFQKNSTIYSTGESSNSIYFINQGEVKISRSTNEGKEITLENLISLDTFGEAEALQRTERKNTASAKKDSFVYILKRDLFLEKLGANQNLALWVINRISKKQIQIENLLESLLFKSANAKVASLLISLGNQYGKEHKNGVLINYSITHQEIGNIIATTRETVSYAFMEFRHLGLIDTVKRRTLILNLQELRTISEE